MVPMIRPLDRIVKMIFYQEGHKMKITSAQGRGRGKRNAMNVWWTKLNGPQWTKLELPRPNTPGWSKEAQEVSVFKGE